MKTSIRGLLLRLFGLPNALAVTLILAAMSPAAHAVAVADKFDLTPIFNADGILNTNTPTGYDVGGNQLDASGNVLVTNAAALRLSPTTGNGLPDNGTFLTNADHPFDVILNYLDTGGAGNDGNNCWQSNVVNNVVISAPRAERYTNVHVFLTGASAPAATAIVTLTYTDGTTFATNITVPDWVGATPAGFYTLFDNGDRATTATPPVHVDSNAAAIFGLNIAADNTKILGSVTLARTGGTGRISLFGIYGYTATGATIATWDGGGGNANWGTAANWVGDTLPANDGTAEVVFNGTVQTTVNLEAAKNVRTLIMNGTATNAFTLNGLGLTVQSSITNLHNANALTINSTVTAGANLTVSSAGTLAFSGGLGGGAVTLTKQGGGTASIATAASYTGATTVTSGTLTFSNLNSIGTSGLVTNGTLTFDQTSNNFNLGLAASGTGALRKTGAANLTVGVAQTYTGSTTLLGGTTTLNVTNALPAASALVIGDNTGATANLSLNNVSQTVASLTIGSNSATVNTITIPAGQTLTSNGPLVVGVAPAADGRTTLATFTGLGTFAIVNAAGTSSIGLANSNQGNPVNTTTVDLTSLGQFTADVAELRVGFESRNFATLKLSNTANTITATTVRIGDSGVNNGTTLPDVTTLTLGSGTGATNVFNVDNLIVGGGKIGALFAFASQAPGSPGTVSIQGKTAAGAAIIVGRNVTVDTGSIWSATADFRGHVSTVVCSTLTLGSWNRATLAGTGTGILNFDTGTFTANTVVMGAKTGASTGIATSGVLNLSGGVFTVNAGGGIVLGSQTGAGGGNGTLNITGGVLNCNGNITDGGGVTVSTLTVNGGTLNMAGFSIGSATVPIDTLNFQGGALANVAEINNGAGLTKTTTGVLLLNGTNTYTPLTTVSQGTLGGTGSVATSVTLANGTFLAPGDPAVALGVGTFTIAGLSVAPTATMNLTINGNAADRLNVTGAGSVDLSSLNLVFAASGISTQEFVLVDVPNGTITGTFPSITGTPANYAVRYTPNQVLLVRGEMDVSRGATAIASGSTDTIPNAVVSVPTSLTYTIANNGGGTLNLTGVPAVVLSGFTNCTAVVSTPPATTIASLASTTTVIDVTPGGGGGVFSFNVSIANDDPNENPYTWTVSGIGIAPELDVSRGGAVADGGTDTIGGRTATATSSITYTLTNSGIAPLTVGMVTLGSQTNCTAVVNTPPGTPVAPSGTTSLIVDVTPGVGPFSFTVSIVNNDFDENPYNFTVSGTGITPEINVLRGVTSIPSGGTDNVGNAFPSQVPSMLTYTIANVGNDVLDISGASTGSPVNCTASVSTLPPSTVAPGGPGSMVITFTPIAAGPYSFTVTINSDDLDEATYTFTVSGVITPNVSLNPSGALITTEIGGSANFTVGLTTIPAAVVTVAISSTNMAEGTVSASLLTFQPNASALTPQPVTVTGVDDLVIDGNVNYTVVIGAAQSTDPSYNGIDAPDYAVTNIDNETASVLSNVASGIVTQEPNVGTTITFRLGSVPSAPVTLTLASSDTTEGTVAPATLTFQPDSTALNAQTVTVTGADDGIVDGNVAYSIQLLPLVSGDPNYNGLDPADISAVNNDDDISAVIVTPFTGLTTTEAGGSATFTVVLGSFPTSDVVIGISSSDTTEGVVSASALTFTPANARTPQTVTVTGVDDFFADGNIPFTIVTAPAATSDPFYAGIDGSDVNVVNTDNDVASFKFVPAEGLSTTEGGGTASFSVVLTSVPSGDVRITLSSSNPAEGTVSPTTLIFVPSTALTPQSVTVTGVNDAVSDGNISYLIVTSAAVSTDVSYSGFNPPDVPVVNLDDDFPSFTSNPTATPNPALVGTPVTFTAGASPASTTILWNFGDGTAGSGPSITHTYTTPGLYPVTATISNGGGPSVTLSIDMFVAADVDGGGGTPGTIGVLIGGSGLGKESGSSAKLQIDHRNPSRSKFEGTLGQIRFPLGVEPADLLNKPGSLVIGTGAKAQEFFFTVDKKGAAKATGLPKLKFDFRRATFMFKISGRPGLAEYAETVGVVYTPGVKTGTPVVVRIPATLRVGNVLLAMTYELKVQQKNTVSKGVLNGR